MSIAPGGEPMHEAVPLLQDYLQRTARERPGRIALVTEGERFTYADIEARANGLARTLTSSGTARGDRVLVFCDNSMDAVVAFWAVLKACAVVVPIHPQTKLDRLAFIANDARASALLVDAKHAPLAKDVIGRAPHLRAVLDCGDTVISARPPPCTTIEGDLAAILYTSGSTGEAKGVMLTHRNMRAAAESVSSYLGMTEEDTTLCVLPLSFDYGLYQMLMTFRLGGRLLLEKSFTYPRTVLDRVVAEAVTIVPGVPTIFSAMADMRGIQQLDFRRVRLVTNTAAAIPVKHLVRLKELFPFARIFSMYGLTECQRCTYLPPEDLARKPTSVGRAIPNTEIWLVDTEDRKVGPHMIGQLVVRGPTVMAGYWERPEETTERLRPGPVPGERVLYTGDLGFLDEDGYFTFVGRTDDLIESRGEKVPPRAVESMLYSIPGVKEAAVIGIPDELLGRAPVAYVVLEADADVDAATIKQTCEENLEPHMVPKWIEIAKALPRSQNGKIDRRALAGMRASS